MNTALGHPLIASYLRQLDVALARQGAGAAAELSEQLRAHLQEALPPDASDTAVAGVLAALGPPDVVAAAARDDRGWLPRLSRRMACWVRRLSWPARISLTAIVLALVVPASAVVYWQAQAGLTFRNGGYGWWYRADYIRQVSTQAGGATQSTVPFRPGQVQGYSIDVYNPSDVTQQILGSPDGDLGYPPGFARVDLANVTIRGSHDAALAKFRRHGSIPPHSYGWVRVLWKTELCDGPGLGIATNQLTLWVRVGWITRTEVIALPTTLALVGTSASQRSAYCLATYRHRPAQQPPAR